MVNFNTTARLLNVNYMNRWYKDHLKYEQTRKYFMHFFSVLKTNKTLVNLKKKNL